MRKHLLALFLILVCSPAFSAWDKNKPTLDDYLYDWPAQVQANWDAIETGTDPALLITNEKVSATASIADTKLASITTAGKVSGTAITGLASLPSGAGAVPIANGGTGQTTRQGALDALLDTQTGNSGKALVTNGTNGSWGYPASLTVASATQGDVLYYNGTAWTRLAPGTTDYALVSNGAGVAPAYEQVNLATAVQGTLPVANGGTGQTSSANAINALLPSQTGNSGKYLTTNGSASSWGAVASGLSLVSTTTLSAETGSPTKHINIDETKKYLVVYNLYAVGIGNPAYVGLNKIGFNSVASGAKYFVKGKGKVDYISPAGMMYALDPDLDATQVLGKFFIDFTSTSDDGTMKTAQVIGDYTEIEPTGNSGNMAMRDWNSLDFAGAFSAEGTAITTLDIGISNSYSEGAGSAGVSGKILLYEIVQ